MKTLLTAVLAAATLGAAPEPVAWSVDGAAPTVKAGGRFAIRIRARIQDGWHLYSMKPLPEGPIPTRLWLADGQPFSLAGPIGATEPRAMQDASFGMEVELYEGEAVFTLPVRVAAGAPPGARKVVVQASYQTCDERICLPPKTLSIEVPVTVAK